MATGERARDNDATIMCLDKQLSTLIRRGTSHYQFIVPTLKKDKCKSPDRDKRRSFLGG